MTTIQREADGCFHPTTEEELCALVAEANAQKKQLRVLGSTHSVWRAIVTDNFNGAQTPSNEMPVVLDRYVKIFEPKPDPTNPDGKLVEVQGGCHLGISPKRPVQGRIDPVPAVSDVPQPSPWHDGTWESSLTQALQNLGLALPDLGGISHQTVAGFLSTGSAGGTVKWSVHEAIAALRVIDGQGNAKTLTADGDDPDWFRAAGVGLGLCGVVSTVTFKCVPTFDIVGQEASSAANMSPDMDFYANRPSANLPSLEKFIIDTDYTRIMWWPQYNFDRLVTWKASRSVYDPNRVLKPYEEVGRFAVVKQFAISFIYTVMAYAEDPVEARKQLTLLAQQAKVKSPEALTTLKNFKLKPSHATLTAPAEPQGCLQGIIDLLTRVKRDPVTMGDAWIRLIELLSTGTDDLVEMLDKLPFFDWLLKEIGKAIPDHIDELYQLFITTQPDGGPITQYFEDRGYMGLPMDNQMDDLILPTWFTELWVPFTPGDGKVQDTITRLRKYFTADGTPQGAYKATGAFAFEMYAGKKDERFFLSPATGQHVFRVDAFWFGKNPEDPVKTFFPPLWKVLDPLGFRAHWGKFQPPPGSVSPSMISRYPDAARWKAVRARVDPNNVFLTSYWKQQLEL